VSVNAIYVGANWRKRTLLRKKVRFYVKTAIESHHRIQTCDPWAVRSKKIFREEAGLKGTDGLTELQKDIYEFIVSSGGVKKEEIARKFGISLLEAENQFALLRHCELVKGQKRTDGVYIVPF
jgi:hypothetical protein